jgi:hypothetical protein
MVTMTGLDFPFLAWSSSCIGEANDLHINEGSQLWQACDRIESVDLFLGKGEAGEKHEPRLQFCNPNVTTVLTSIDWHA